MSIEEKRQEIREGIAKVIHQFTMEDEEWDDLLPEWKADFLKDAGKIAQFLHSQGVVIKVEGELPQRTWYSDWGGESGKAGYELCKGDMAGFTATAPLIEEAKSGS